MRNAIKLMLMVSLSTGSILYAGMHPSYDLINIRPADFKPLGVGGLDFLPDGRMVISEYGHTNGSDGKVYILSGTDGDSPAGVTTQLFADNLREPLGVKVVDGVIYVLQDHELTKLTDDNSDGTAELTTIATGWNASQNNNWAVGLEFSEGNFHFLTSAWNVNDDADKGCWIMVPLAGAGTPAGNYVCAASGLRSPDGIGLGPEGELFATDNQGNWNPTNDIYHLRQGRFFGYLSNNGDLFADEPASIGTAYLEEEGTSITEPHFLTSGPYAGQVLVGDIPNGIIYRIFLERMKGEYQSATFTFCNSTLGDVVDGINTLPGEFEAGVHRIRQGPDGDIYLGELGAGKYTVDNGGPGNGLGGNWSWGGRSTGTEIGTWTGLQKLRHNGATTFEMKAIRSTLEGFEIEFTEPAGTGADQAANYTLRTWYNDPIQAYGGGALSGERAVTVSSATVSADKKKVSLAADPAQFLPDPGQNFVMSILHFALGAVKSESGKDVYTTEARYSFNAQGPADVLGCMDNTNPNFNPAAVYDDGLQCQNTSGVKPQNRFALEERIRVHKSDAGVYRLHINLESEYKITLTDAAGRVMDTFQGQKPGVYYVNQSGKRNGIYFVNILAGNNTITKKLAVF